MKSNYVKRCKHDCYADILKVILRKGRASKADVMLMARLNGGISGNYIDVLLERNIISVRDVESNDYGYHGGRITKIFTITEKGIDYLSLMNKVLAEENLVEKIQVSS